MSGSAAAADGNAEFLSMSLDVLIGRKAHAVDVHKEPLCTTIIRRMTFAMPFRGWRRLCWEKLHMGHRGNTGRAGSWGACPHSALRIPQRTGHSSDAVSLTDDFQAYGDSLDHGRLPSLIRFNATPYGASTPVEQGPSTQDIGTCVSGTCARDVRP